MNQRFLLSTLTAALVSVMTLVTMHAAFGQPEAGKAGWTAPRTPWGEPDLQGLWPTGDWLGVPLQRAESLGTRNVLSPDEFAAREQQAAQEAASDSEEYASGNGSISNSPPSYWQDRGVPKTQASLIVEPPNGRVPAITQAAEQRIAARAAARQGRGPSDSWTDRSYYERCIFRTTMNFIPTRYNNGNEILQSPGYVIIRHEMINDTRIVPISDEPFSNIRTYLGESRGRWEGDTLVVVTKNFVTDATVINQTPVSDDLVVTERFTRVADHALRYQSTVNDPGTWAEPWTVSFDLNEDPAYPLIEYACHEGNYALENILKAARLADAERARAGR